MFDLSAELLRVEAPSADVQGHGADQKQTPDGKKHVTIHNIEPVGIMLFALHSVMAMIQGYILGKPCIVME